MTRFSESRRVNVERSRTPKSRGALRAAVAAAVLLIAGLPAAAQLSVEIVNGYNLVIDSNVTAPSTYAPGAAYIGARVCNTSMGTTLNNVFLNAGDFGPNTPGVFPSHTFPSLAHLAGTGSYSLTLESGETGTSDGSRYIGSLAPGACRIQYWLISYPQCVNNPDGSVDTPPCTTSVAGGSTTADDPSLTYDIWATADSTPTVSATRSFTLRNEISAAANKIWPNNTSKVPDEYLTALQAIVGWGTLGPDGQPYDGSNPVYPGQRVITTQGIWYDLGNVNGGFDNDGDLVADQNAWLQPVGDASLFDAGCFRLVNVYGIVVVKLKSGGELLIPFQNELYFTGIPDNTGVVGLVYYQYVATSEGCNAQMSPYQEAASGSNNEKFSADYGLSLPLESGEFDPGDVSLSKTDNTDTTSIGSTLTYTINAANDILVGPDDIGVNLGVPDLGMPLSLRDSIPAGTQYVAGSATAGLTAPTGTGTYKQGFTGGDGVLDVCTVGYNITPASQWVVFYSIDGGATWTLTEPPAASVTDLQWRLITDLALDGGHDGTNCIGTNGVYDNGTENTSLPSGKSLAVTFQVTVQSSVGPVIENEVVLGFGGNLGNLRDSDTTLVSGFNTISGTVFRDDATGGGIFANGTRDGGETGIGAGVVVTLYYDLNGDGQLDGGDLQYGPTTTTSGTGTYSFSSLPDGPFLVVVEKYDDGSGSDSATDSSYGTAGWGSTTRDPNLPLATDTGVVKLSETSTTTVLAVNVDLDRSTVAGQTVSTANFGFAPPLVVTKRVAGNPDLNANMVADATIDEGSLITYTIALQNRLPSVGVQGPTGCQYVVWASNGGTGSNPKDFSSPTNAWDSTTPNGNVATALVEGGGLRWIYGTSYALTPQLGNITKVEGLFFGYFNTALTDDFLNLTAGLAGSGVGSNGITGTLSTFTINTALIDTYVGVPDDFEANSAINWDLTSLRPGGGSWSWTDFPGMFLQMSPSKAASADAKIFSLDAIGIRVTSDQACVAGASTTLSPVPLQDTYDASRLEFVSASPTPTSVNTGTGVIRWDDVGPILPGSTTTVIVTLRARDLAGTNTGSCAALPTVTSGCNYAQSTWGGNVVEYADGRPANNDDDAMAVTIIGKAELRGTVFNDANNTGWPLSGDAGLAGINVTLWGCVRSDGITMETGTSSNKTCVTITNGNSWKALRTVLTDSIGAYEFIGLNSGYYLVEVGDNDGSPAGGNTAPYGKTRTAEPLDTQTSTAGNANGATCGTCNGVWGNSAADLLSNQTTINFLDAATEETINGVNFGFFSNTADLFGTVWYDVDGDATKDPGDVGQSGFTINLYSDPNGDGNPADGTLIATRTTDANGNYTFTGLAAGTYVVVSVPPTLPTKAWVETVETVGGTGSLDNRMPLTLTAGQVSGPNEFGYTQSDTADIGDSLFFDVDGDGIRDSGETGIPNVTVHLYSDLDRDGVIDAGFDTILDSVSSDASGNYLFEDYPAGSYIVLVDMTDPDFPTSTTPTADPDLYTGRIGDLVFFDADGNGAAGAGENGIPGVTVDLYRDVDGNGILDPGEPVVASAVTNVLGGYVFTGLSAGTYFVDVDDSTLPSATLAVTTGAISPVTLATSSSSVLTVDIGYSPPTNFAIGNRVWHDVDNDGVQDAGEVGIPGVDITVTGAGCAPCTATTDESGFWIVTGLTNSAVYSVALDDTDLPRNFTATTGTTDPRNVTITGADNMNVDFGYRYTGAGSSPTASVTGRVWLDSDGDAAYDAGEERAGITVNLLDANGYIVATTTTDGTGNYAFNGAFVGSYSVQAVDTLGTRYSSVFLSAGQPFTGLNVIYNTTSATVADGQAAVSIDGVHDNLLMDFGFQRFLGSIGDLVYYDVNANGTRDLGEPGLAGVTVELYTASWTDDGDGFVVSGEVSGATLVATATTSADNPATTSVDESGLYLFSNLDPPAVNTYYLVRVVSGTLPANSFQTGDPDADGTPCAALPSASNPAPAGVCDHEQLVISWREGNNYLGGDFGYDVQSFASIGDHLWVDTDGGGDRDAGEPGIANVTVWLDTDNDGVLDPGERSVETDGDGFYVFANVADGTYNVRVLTTDPQWPTGLPTTPTYEAGTATFNNHVAVTVSSGNVTAITGGTCAGLDCGLDVDFGYRYPGTNSVSGTICTDDATGIGFCGATATTYSGTGPGESPLSGIQVSFYRWTDDSDNVAWDGVTGTLDGGDSFTFFGSTTTDSNGDYSMSNLPDNVVVVFSLPAAQNLLLNTTNGNTSVEGTGVVSRQLYNGTSTFDGNTVTVLARQALNLGTGPNVVRDLDYAFDITLGGAIAYDFGDLPSSYSNTLLSQGGARALVASSPDSIRLGALITSESDGTQATFADFDGGDDGISNVPPSVDRNVQTSFTATVSANGWLGGWIDWDGDGNFNGPGENFVDQAVTAGPNTISFTPPATLSPGATAFFTRFRVFPSRPTLFSSTGVALNATFQPAEGEVEDYQWNITVTPAIVTSFVARPEGSVVVLEWTTAAEIGTAGFYVRRQDPLTGEWSAVNDELLAALIVSPQGGRYRFVDRQALRGVPYRYELVEVEWSGRLSSYGSVGVTPEPLPLEPDENAVTLESDPYHVDYSRAAHPVRTGTDVKPLDRVAKQSDPKKPVATGAKIAVGTTGIQFVPVASIETAGFAVDKTWLTSNKNLYEFSNRGKIVSFMSAPDASGVYFYGEALESIFSGDNVYWLGQSKRNSPRMKVRKQGAVAPPSGAEVFRRAERHEKELVARVYGEFYSDPESSFWVWDFLVAGQGAKSYTFRADAAADTIRDAVLKVHLLGATDTPADPDHHVAIRLNGQKIGETRWNGLEHSEVALRVPSGLLADGDNVIELEPLRDTGAPFSVTYLDWFEVEYDSRYRARGNRLDFTADGNAAVFVSGFTRPDVMVFDVTDPLDPVYVEVSSMAAGSGYGVAIAPGSPSSRYVALTPDAVTLSTRIKPDTPSTLASSGNVGEYLVITTSALASTAQRLADYRADLASQVIDIEDVWDEFNFGIARPHALRAFIDHALKNWSVKPKYVVLAGGGTFDYRDFYGIGDNLLPPMHVNTPFGLFPSDNWFANTDTASATPEVAIGRIPATTAAELSAAIDKIIARERQAGSPWQRSLLMLADNADAAGNFPVDSDRVAAVMPSGTAPQKIYLSNMPASVARSLSVNAINQGAGLVSFIGHGGFDAFAAEGMLRIADLGLLANAERPTVVTGMTCNVGYFSLPGYASLGERLLLDSNGGAAAVWVATGMSQNEQAVALAKAFYRIVSEGKSVRVGDAIRAALAAYAGESRPSYMIDIYTLLGDPAMKLY